MSLFPAYSQEATVSSPGEAEAGAAMSWADASSPYEADAAMVPCGEAERELLESSDSEPEAPPAPASRAEPEPDYYVDRHFDGGNLRVSTIYYPGRPQYNSGEFHLALGMPRAVGRRKRARRYWEAGGAAERACAGTRAEGEGERGAALRRALVDRPQDVELWLQYVDYQEWVHGDEAALAAAEAATARAPRAAALRARRLALVQRTESAQDYVTRLRDELTQEKEPLVSAELWCHLVSALSRTPAAGVSGAQAAAAAAVRACRRLPAAYPNILYAYGSVVRAAGLWETLVLLLELVLAAAPPAAPAAFPPVRDACREAAAERRLQDYEDKVARSGLPTGAVWARVERARGAAHWRPARAGDADADLDPQRAPTLADVADLVVPCADAGAVFLLLVNALRLAKVPLLPGAQWVHAAAGAGAAAWDCGEALLALAAAARRVPPTHAAHASRVPPTHAAHAPPGAARDLVRRAVDPPHYFSDDYGYRGWVDALWDAALTVASADGVVALLCWRLRWLHAQLLLLPESPSCATEAAEARRVRDAAQSTLKRWGGSHALAFALFARVAHAAARRGGGGRADAGRRAAVVALRAAMQDTTLPHHYLLYIARIVDEVHDGAGGDGGGSAAVSAAGGAALAAAALRQALPADLADLTHTPQYPYLLRDAREECERRCAAIEEEISAEEEHSSAMLGCGSRLLRALLPSEAEWGVTRVLLADQARRHDLLQQLLVSGTGTGRAARWREQAAAALVLRTRRGTAAARELSRRYPNNALLAIVSSGTPLWSNAAAADCSLPAARALGAAWPALLAAAAAAAPPAAAGTLARRLRGGGAGEGASLPWALRLEAEARAPHPRLEYVAHAAMDALPGHKWLAVRAAALGAARGGGALPDVLLERGLRLHALPDELRALAPDEPKPNVSP